MPTPFACRKMWWEKVFRDKKHWSIVIILFCGYFIIKKMETTESEYNVLLDLKHSMRKKTMNRKVFLFTGDVKEEHWYHCKPTSSVLLWICFTVQAPYGLGFFCKLLFHKSASLLRSHVSVGLNLQHIF